MKYCHHRSVATSRPMFHSARDAILSACVLSLLAGCASSRMPFPGEPATFGEPGKPLVWPRPPVPARVVFVRSVSGARDLGIQEPLLRRILNVVVGRDDDAKSFVNPIGISVDKVGNICVTDPGSGAVYFFDHARGKLRRWTSIGKQEFISPVAVAKRQDTIFVADSSLGKVLAFNVKGKPVFTLSQGLKRPTGVAISGDTLVIADAGLHKIMLSDAHGKFLSEFGTRGSATGKFNFPTHVAADQQGLLYVTDSMNSRVQVFDAKGKFVRVIGEVGDGTGHFSRPKGVAVDRLSRAYVVDALFDNVQIFDSEGRFLLHWGEAGERPGQFWLPAGIAIGEDGYIYVADQFNHRIQIFKYVGEP